MEMTGWHSGPRMPLHEVKRQNFTHGAWCDVCKRNGRVHTHKCKECDHMETGDVVSRHNDGLCFWCHPGFGKRVVANRPGHLAMLKKIAEQVGHD
jgi:hypothetical protein